MALRDRVLSNRDAILALAAQYDAVNVRLFGSVARGDDRPDSDIDFLVDRQRAWTLLDHIGMMQDLEDLLQCKDGQLMGKKNHRKAIQSLTLRIEEHQEKIRLELDRELPDQGLIEHWQKEIRAFEKGIQQAHKRLEN